VAPIFGADEELSPPPSLDASRPSTAPGGRAGEHDD
jgi:hypothetical protein